MENREEIVAYIKKRLKEKKLNPRRLSLLAGASADLIRNFLSGKSRVMKSNHYNKVMEILSDNEIGQDNDPIRGQIDSAIILWARNGNKNAINTLIATAYKSLRPEENDKPLIDKDNEALILSCLMKLQSLGNKLNSLEISFIFWMVLQFPSSFKDDIKELCAQVFNINDINQLGKLDKSTFIDFLNKDRPPKI